jgi:hypothetical protein
MLDRIHYIPLEVKYLLCVIIHDLLVRTHRHSIAAYDYRQLRRGSIRYPLVLKSERLRLYTGCDFCNFNAHGNDRTSLQKHK